MIDIKSIDVHSLPSIPLESRFKLPSEPAVYFVIDSLGDIQYIGKSANLKRRWYGHHRQKQFDAINDIRIAYLLMGKDLLESVEKALIDWLNPVLNNSATSNSSSNTVDTAVKQVNAIQSIRAKAIAFALAKREKANAAA